MDFSSTAPYPFASPKTDLLDAWTVSGNRPLTYFTHLGIFDGRTDDDWQTLEVLLEGIKSFNERLGDRCNFGVPARAELIRQIDHASSGERRRGMVVFDNRGEALFQVANALLGYGGAGPTLSRQILTAMGVPEQMFNRANEESNSQNHAVIFSREACETREGVVASTLWEPVGEWRYWHLPS